MDERYRSIRVAFVLRSDHARPQQPLSTDRKVLTVESSQFTTPWTVSIDSVPSIHSFHSSSTIVNSKIFPSIKIPYFDKSSELGPVKCHHKNRIDEEKRKKAERKKNCPLAKIICCGLVCSLIAAGIATLIGGLILMRQRNTNITTVEKSTSTMTTITTSTSVTSTSTTTTETTTTITTTLCPTTSITTTVTSSALPSECSSYTLITDGTRYVSFFNTSISLCDNVLPFSTAPTWFRFSGAAGTLIASCAVSSYHCGTFTPGYYTGLHPSTAGATLTGMMCFNNSLTASCYFSNTISVTNCNGYYVYDLTQVPSCDARYCTI